MKIINTPKWLMPFGHGLTLYKLAFVRKDLTGYRRDYVIAHELCHVHQWTEIGIFKFPYLYIKELIRMGYYQNKYEVEAREYGVVNADRWRKMCCGSN